MESIALRVRWLIILAALIVVTMKLPAGTPYKAMAVRDGGTITGVVRLNGDSPKPLTFAITKDNDWCGRKKASPRLVLGKNNGIRNTVISLEGISQGKRPVIQQSYLLDQRRCEYEPHVLLLPTGGNLEIVNSDRTLHNVHAYSGGEEMRTMFNIAQPVKGFRFPVKAEHFKTPGVYLATCDAGHPWMSAYIVVAEHPYYALTDANGKFELTDVPPGTYTITLWHEGVAVTRTEMEGGKPKAFYYEAPYQDKKEVVVPAKATVVVDFTVILREGVLTQK